MGTDTISKKTSYMGSLIPKRFRTKNGHSDLDDKASTKTLEKNIGPDVSDSDTVLPGQRNAKSGSNSRTTALKFQSFNTSQADEANVEKEFQNQSEAPFLVYKTSYGGDVSYYLTRSETLVGRKEGNHIILTDSTISKFHAKIFRSLKGVTVMDRGSTNGVKINDQALIPEVPQPLRTGDTLMIGSIKLMFYEKASAVPTQPAKPQTEGNLNLVTILPIGGNKEERLAIKAELEEECVDFKKVDLVTDINVLREDYEKLRLAYELSKITLTNDLSAHLEKSLELIFEIISVDRGVVLLVDQNTGMLSTRYVKLRSEEYAGQEIILSSTVLTKVYESRKCLVTTDASQDTSLQAAKSIIQNEIRTVICVPLIGHNLVHGIIHLDATNSIGTVSRKDLSIITALSNQTAIAIENSILVKEYENNVKVKDYLSRFLPPHVVEKMANPADIIKKGGSQMVGSIIFVDIRGFTNMSEKLPPQDIVYLLNDYFERLVRIVFKYNGIVDKYIGDALMAVFGTLEDDKDAEFRAVSAAFEFKQAIAEMNEDRARFNKQPIAIGVGVNTGELLAGFLGSSLRLEYTVIGDSVNTSSRVCSMASKNQVLISEYTYEYVKDRIQAKKIGAKQFKGKEKEVIVYEVLAIAPPENLPQVEPASNTTTAGAVEPILTNQKSQPALNDEQSPGLLSPLTNPILTERNYQAAVSPEEKSPLPELPKADDGPSPATTLMAQPNTDTSPATAVMEKR